MSGAGEPMFFLRVSYTAPSTLRTFLGPGWRPRDIRGPYLTAAEGFIVIPSVLLSEEHPTKLLLGFALSARSDVDALFVRVDATSFDGSVPLKRNRGVDMTVHDFYPDRAPETIIRVRHSDFEDRQTPGTKDIVIIEELRIWR